MKFAIVSVIISICCIIVNCSVYGLPDKVFCADDKCRASIGTVKLIKTYSDSSGVHLKKDDIVKVFARSSTEWKVQYLDNFAYVDKSYLKLDSENIKLDQLNCIANPDITSKSPVVNQSLASSASSLNKNKRGSEEIEHQSPKKINKEENSANERVGNLKSEDIPKTNAGIKKDVEKSTPKKTLPDTKVKSAKKEARVVVPNKPDEQLGNLSENKKVVKDSERILLKEDPTPLNKFSQKKNSESNGSIKKLPEVIKADANIHVNDKVPLQSRSPLDKESMESRSPKDKKVDTAAKPKLKASSGEDSRQIDAPGSISLSNNEDVATAQKDISSGNIESKNVNQKPTHSEDDKNLIHAENDTKQINVEGDKIQLDVKENDNLVAVEKPTSIGDDKISNGGNSQKSPSEKPQSASSPKQQDPVAVDSSHQQVTELADNSEKNPNENFIAHIDKSSIQSIGLMQCISEAASRFSSPKSKKNDVPYSPLAKSFLYIYRINIIMAEKITLWSPTSFLTILSTVSDGLAGIHHQNLLIWIIFLTELFLLKNLLNIIKYLCLPTDIQKSSASQSDYMALQKRLGEYHSKYVESENMNANLLTSKQQLAKEYAELNEELSNVNGDLLELQKANKKLLDDCDNLVKDSDKDKSNVIVIEKLKKQISAKNVELEEVKESHDQLAKKFNELEESSVNELASCKTKFKAEKDDFIGELQAKLEKTVADLVDKEQIIEQVRSELQDKQTQVESYYKDMLQMQNDVETNAHARSVYEKQLAERDSELHSLRESFMQLKNLENAFLQARDSTNAFNHKPIKRRTKRVKKLIPQLPVMREELIETEEEVEVTDEEPVSEENEKESFMKLNKESVVQNSFSENQEDGDGWEDDIGWELEADLSERSKEKRKKLVKMKKIKTIQVPVEQPPLEVSTSEEDMDDIDCNAAQPDQSVVNLQAKLTEFLDVAKLRTEISMQNEKFLVSEAQCKREQELRLQIEKRLANLEEEMNQRQSDYDHANSERQTALNKLEILSSYFKEREIELQKNLGKQVVVQSDTTDEMVMYKEKCEHAEIEIKVLKDQITSFKREMMETEKNCRRQVTEFDKRSHENWLALRKSESLLKELREENVALRQRLQDSHRNVMSRAMSGGSGNKSGSGSNSHLYFPPPPPPPPMMFPDSSMGAPIRRPKSRQSTSNRSDQSSPAQSLFGTRGGAVPPPPPMPFSLMSSPPQALPNVSKVNGSSRKYKR